MNNSPSPVPAALRNWFMVHCIVDLLFAIPVFAAPVFLLELAGWRAVDPITARMVAAALFGIGLESALCRNAGTEVFRAMLNLKIIWSFCAVTGLSLALAKGLFGIPAVGIIFLGIFVCFNVLWIYWRIKIGAK